MQQLIDDLQAKIIANMMYKPIFDYDIIIKMIEDQNNNIEVVKVKYMSMPSYDSQTFCVLEWFNNREYCIRMYYNHLIPSMNTGARQPMGQGSGGYVQLFDREGDKEQAIIEFDRTAKLYKEDM